MVTMNRGKMGMGLATSTRCCRGQAGHTDRIPRRTPCPPPCTAACVPATATAFPLSFSNATHPMWLSKSGPETFQPRDHHPTHTSLQSQLWQRCHTSTRTIQSTTHPAINPCMHATQCSAAQHMHACTHVRPCECGRGPGHRRSVGR